MSTDSPGYLSIIEQVIPSLVSAEENVSLLVIPSVNEICGVIKNLGRSSTLGPDGFARDFFSQCLEIVENDVCSAIQSFFHSRFIEPGLNSCNMVFISKCNQASFIGQYRPIFIGNFLSKVIEKIFALHLAPTAAKVVSIEQLRFLQGRNMQHCIEEASKCTNLLLSRSQLSSMALKVDIQKAIDTMQWDFFFEVLQCFGFCEVICEWVWAILGSVRISILSTGSPNGYLF